MHRPSFYAERFQRFMCNTVFKKIPRKYRGAIALVSALLTGALGSLSCCVTPSFSILSS